MGQQTGKLAVIGVFKLATIRASLSAGHRLINPVENQLYSVERRFFVNSASRGHCITKCLYQFCSCGNNVGPSLSMSSQCANDKPYINSNGQYTVPDGTCPCHVKARGKIYPRTKDIERTALETDEVSWDNDCPWYEEKVKAFTSAGVLKGPEWADKEDPSEQGISFNMIQDTIDRKSYMGEYKIVDGYPRNPRGRTGLRGRGCLGRWGPNHAGDPIVTRWKRNESNDIVVHPDSGKPILQFVAVQRSDNGEWALPGGMVNAGENKTMALKREFGEEALNSLEASDEEHDRIQEVLKTFFVKGNTIYKGYVDDPRNTDNSWMETKAINFHDESGDGVGAFKLHAGDDAIGVKWMDIDSQLNLYASHIDFIQGTVKLRNAHW